MPPVRPRGRAIAWTVRTLDALPVGASIDRTGTFYWQPGASFKGVFDLRFIRTSCDGSKQQLAVQATIR